MGIVPTKHVEMIDTMRWPTVGVGISPNIRWYKIFTLLTYLSSEILLKILKILVSLRRWRKLKLAGNNQEMLPANRMKKLFYTLKRVPIWCHQLLSNFDSICYEWGDLLENEKLVILRKRLPHKNPPQFWPPPNKSPSTLDQNIFKG